MTIKKDMKTAKMPKYSVKNRNNTSENNDNQPKSISRLSKYKTMMLKLPKVILVGYITQICFHFYAIFCL